MKRFVVFLIYVISTISAAPAGQNSLYNVVMSDPRTKNVQKRRFINECRNPKSISKSICLAVYDVALTFNSKDQSFNIVNATFEEGKFCQSLAKVLPDSPANNDSSTNFKDVQWFKDVSEEQCENKCFFEDPNNYEKSLIAVCRFLYNQFSYLSSESQKQPEKDEKSESRW